MLRPLRKTSLVWDTWRSGVVRLHWIEWRGRRLFVRVEQPTTFPRRTSYCRP